MRLKGGTGSDRSLLFMPPLLAVVFRILLRLSDFFMLNAGHRDAARVVLKNIGQLPLIQW